MPSQSAPARGKGEETAAARERGGNNNGSSTGTTESEAREEQTTGHRLCADDQERFALMFWDLDSILPPVESKFGIRRRNVRFLYVQLRFLVERFYAGTVWGQLFKAVALYRRNSVAHREQNSAVLKHFNGLRASCRLVRSDRSLRRSIRRVGRSSSTRKPKGATMRPIGNQRKRQLHTASELKAMRKYLRKMKREARSHRAPLMVQLVSADPLKYCRLIRHCERRNIPVSCVHAYKGPSSPLERLRAMCSGYLVHMKRVPKLSRVRNARQLYELLRRGQRSPDSISSEPAGTTSQSSGAAVVVKRPGLGTGRTLPAPPPPIMSLMTNTNTSSSRTGSGTTSTATTLDISSEEVCPSLQSSYGMELVPPVLLRPSQGIKQYRVTKRNRERRAELMGPTGTSTAAEEMCYLSDSDAALPDDPIEGEGKEAPKDATTSETLSSNSDELEVWMAKFPCGPFPKSFVVECFSASGGAECSRAATVQLLANEEATERLGIEKCYFSLVKRLDWRWRFSLLLGQDVSCKGHADPSDWTFLTDGPVQLWKSVTLVAPPPIPPKKDKPVVLKESTASSARSEPAPASPNGKKKKEKAKAQDPAVSGRKEKGRGEKRSSESTGSGRREEKKGEKRKGITAPSGTDHERSNTKKAPGVSPFVAAPPKSKLKSTKKKSQSNDDDDDDALLDALIAKKDEQNVGNGTSAGSSWFAPMSSAVEAQYIPVDTAPIPSRIAKGDAAGWSRAGLALASKGSVGKNFVDGGTAIINGAQHRAYDCLCKAVDAGAHSPIVHYISVATSLASCHLSAAEIPAISETVIPAVAAVVAGSVPYPRQLWSTLFCHGRSYFDEEVCVKLERSLPLGPCKTLGDCWCKIVQIEPTLPPSQRMDLHSLAKVYACLGFYCLLKNENCGPPYTHTFDEVKYNAKGCFLCSFDINPCEPSAYHWNGLMCSLGEYEEVNVRYITLAGGRVSKKMNRAKCSEVAIAKHNSPGVCRTSDGKRCSCQTVTILQALHITASTHPAIYCLDSSKELADYVSPREPGGKMVTLNGGAEYHSSVLASVLLERDPKTYNYCWENIINSITGMSPRTLVYGQEIDQVRCTLCLLPFQPLQMTCLGSLLANHRTVVWKGKTYNGLECHLRMLQDDKRFARAWSGVAQFLIDAALSGRYNSPCIRRPGMDPTVKFNGREHNARSCALRSVELMPEDSDALGWTVLGTVLKGKETLIVRGQEATCSPLVCYSEALRTSNSDEALSRVAFLVSDEQRLICGGGRTRTAEECICESVQLQSKFPSRWHLCGVWLRERRRNFITVSTDSAVPRDVRTATKHLCDPKYCFMKALQLDPLRPMTWAELGRALRENNNMTVKIRAPVGSGKGESRNAVEKWYSWMDCYRVALTQNSELEEVWTMLGEALKETGATSTFLLDDDDQNPTTAFECFHRSVKLNSGYQRAWEGLCDPSHRELCADGVGVEVQVGGQKHTATSLLERATKMFPHNSRLKQLAYRTSSVSPAVASAPSTSTPSSSQTSIDADLKFYADALTWDKYSRSSWCGIALILVELELSGRPCSSVTRRGKRLYCLVRGQPYSARCCVEDVINGAENSTKFDTLTRDALLWSALGGTVNEENETLGDDLQTRKLDSYQRVLQCNSYEAEALAHVARLLRDNEGITIDNQLCSREDCLRRALLQAQRNNSANVWHLCGLALRAQTQVPYVSCGPGSESYNKTVCFVKAVELDPLRACSWVELGLALHRSWYEACMNDGSVLEMHVTPLPSDSNDPVNYENRTVKVKKTPTSDEHEAEDSYAYFTWMECCQVALKVNAEHAAVWRAIGEELPWGEAIHFGCSEHTADSCLARAKALEDGSE